LTPDPVEAYW